MRALLVWVWCVPLILVVSSSSWGQTSLVSGTEAGFDDPGGITTGGSDDWLYFLDSGSNSQLFRLPASGGTADVIAAGSTQLGRYLRDLAIAPTNDALYYTDDYNAKLYKIGLDGTGREIVATGFSDPDGLALSPFGHVAFVTDTYQDAVYRVNLLTGTKTEIPITGVMLSTPTDVAVSPDGNTLFVVDSGLDAVYTVPARGGHATRLSLGSVLEHPRGISVSRDGSTLFVSDYGNSSSSNTNDGGVFQLSSTVPQTPTLTAFNSLVRNPNDITVSRDQTKLYFTDNASSDGYGDVFVADSGLSPYVPQPFGNMSFESGLDGFFTEGDVNAVASLGTSITPTDGAQMALLTTGRGAVDERLSTLSVALPLVEDANFLAFDFALLTDEEGLDPEFFDTLSVSVVSSGQRLVDQNVVVSTDDVPLVDSPPDVAPQFLRWTEWRTARFSLDPLGFIDLSGESLLLSFILSDVGDTEVITGLLLDNIRISALVPECSTMAMVGFGFLLLTRRRRPPVAARS